MTWHFVRKTTTGCNFKLVIQWLFQFESKSKMPKYWGWILCQAATIVICTWREILDYCLVVSSNLHWGNCSNMSGQQTSQQPFSSMLFSEETRWHISRAAFRATARLLPEKLMRSRYHQTSLQHLLKSPENSRFNVSFTPCVQLHTFSSPLLHFCPPALPACVLFEFKKWKAGCRFFPEALWEDACGNVTWRLALSRQCCAGEVVGILLTGYQANQCTIKHRTGI